MSQLHGHICATQLPRDRNTEEAFEVPSALCACYITIVALVAEVYLVLRAKVVQKFGWCGTMCLEAKGS